MNQPNDVDRGSGACGCYRRAADRLAYEVAKAVGRGAIGSRSAIGDALLDYLGIGTLDGPSDVSPGSNSTKRVNRDNDQGHQAGVVDERLEKT